MPIVSRQVQLASRPEGQIQPGNFRVVERTLADPGEGEILVRNLWISVDAALRLRLGATPPPGYASPLPLDEPLMGLCVGEVLQSNAPGFSAGDVVIHLQGYRDYAVVSANAPTLAGAGSLTVVDVKIAPPQAYLGVLGYTGLTAYAGLLDVAQLRPGDVVWVSAAAGATGSVAAQIARLRGHRVVGSAGTAKKVAWLRDELGLDAAFDHHEDLRAALHRCAPDGIDVYFDNVGGDHLEAALYALREGGRVALCGAVAEYDGAPSRGPRNMFQIVAKSLQLRGFRSGSHVGRMDDMRRELGPWLRAGKLKFREHVFEGLESAPQAIIALLHGETTGKVLIRV